MPQVCESDAKIILFTIVKQITKKNVPCCLEQKKSPESSIEINMDFCYFWR